MTRTAIRDRRAPLADSRCRHPGNPRRGSAGACFQAADPRRTPSDDGGLDTTDGGDRAPVVEAPDLRFKWVGAGLALHFAGFTNLGTALGGNYVQQGPIGVTPMELSGGVRRSTAWVPRRISNR